MKHLYGLEVLVLNALRPRAHNTHFNFEQAIEMAKKLNAKATYFVHMTHDSGHASRSAELPERIYLAYDGLKLVIE
jgi:phosphoribosyl 1,2-cyclic phosphate phosphodiesterase